MSDLGVELQTDPASRRPEPRRRVLGCLAVLVALAVLVGGGYLAYDYGVSALKDVFSPPPDYSGTGNGRVLVEVAAGDTAREIGQTLVGKDVVKSTDAFVHAAREDPRSAAIQPGFYPLRRQMPAASALAVLIDPGNRVRSVVTVPEGLRVDQIVALLAKRTKFTARQFNAVLARPRASRAAVVRPWQPRGLPVPGHLRAPAELDTHVPPDRDGQALRRRRQGSSTWWPRRGRWATRRSR